MVSFRTQHATDGVTDVSAGDTYRHEITDDYRRVTRLDIVGDVERTVYIESKDDSRYYVFGGTGASIRGQGDMPVDVDLEKGDELVIEYEEAGTVSDVWHLDRFPPLRELMSRYVDMEDS